MADSGIRANAAAKAACESVKTVKSTNIPFCVLKITDDSTEIDVVSIAEPVEYTHENYKEAVFDKLYAYVEEHKAEPCWILTDVKFTLPDNAEQIRSSLILISYVPDNLPIKKVKLKMLMGSTTESFKNNINAVKKGIHAGDLGALDYEKFMAQVSHDTR